MIENELSQRLVSPKYIEPKFSDLSEYQTTTQFVISVIVPTRNEAGNVEPLLSRIEQATRGIPTEVIFVDDSTDKTPEVIIKLQDQFSLQIKLVHRPPERRKNGLGGAVLEGFKVAQAPWVCVMDADLQHPPEMLPKILRHAEKTNSDVVVGSRLTQGGDASSLSFNRNIISHVFALTSRIAFPQRLKNVTDPLSGFFILRRALLNPNNLKPDGFKILLEILATHPDLTVSEIPIHFGFRHAGESKASIKETVRYFRTLFRLRLAGDQTFLRFLAVGFSGLLINSLTLALFTEFAALHYLLSAILATQVSTLWNFGLTEKLVFGKRETGRSFIQRLVGFLLINNLLLLLRGPIITLMVSQVGVHYLIANLVSLFAMTVLRYLVADQLIWNKGLATASNANLTQEQETQMTTVKQTNEGTRPEMPQAKPFAFHYNIHDIVTIESDGYLPELEPFRVDTNSPQPTIQVRIGKPRSLKPGEDKKHYMRYRELFGHLGFEVGIEMGNPVNVVASQLLRLSPHVLYTNVIEPLLRWTFVKKGYALVHGATIGFGDKAYMITARTDTGKTTTLLKILAYQRRGSDQATFLSDDMTIVSPDGTAMAYPKPLTISYHTLKAVNSDTLTFMERLTLPFQSRIHSKSGRRFAFVISKSHLPAATINMITQMLIPPPKYFVNKLVPNVKLAHTANLSGMFIIERGEGGILPMKNNEAMEILLQNCEDAYGFPPYEDIREFLYNDNGIDLREKEHAIIRQALGEIPATAIRSSNLDWWHQIPTFVNEEVSYDISAAFKVETAPRNRSSRQPESVSIFPRVLDA